MWGLLVKLTISLIFCNIRFVVKPYEYYRLDCKFTGSDKLKAGWSYETMDNPILSTTPDDPPVLISTNNGCPVYSYTSYIVVPGSDKEAYFCLALCDTEVVTYARLRFIQVYMSTNEGATTNEKIFVLILLFVLANSLTWN